MTISSPVTGSDAGEHEGAFLTAPECQLLTSALTNLVTRAVRAGGGGSLRTGLGALLIKLDSAAAGSGSPLAMVVESQPLTVTAAAAVMGVSERRVRQLAAAGAIIASRHGRRAWLIDRAAAEDYGRERGWGSP